MPHDETGLAGCPGEEVFYVAVVARKCLVCVVGVGHDLAGDFEAAGAGERDGF